MRRDYYRSSVVCLLVLISTSTVLAQEMAMKVSVVKAQKRRLAKALHLVGSIEPNTRSLLASEVDGLVESLPVEEGDRVDTGDAICKLRDKTRRILHGEADAILKQLQAALDELEAGTRKEELAEAKAAMQEARAVYEKWEHELERIKSLRESGSASPKEYNDTVADHAASRERYAQMKASYELAVAGPRAEKIAVARYMLEAQRARVARLKYDLDQTVIRAPFAGYITRKHTEVGEWLSIGGGVVELIDLDRILVRIDVPESAISVIRLGDTVPIIIDALGKTFSGKVKHIIPQADEKARTFPVEVELDNRTGELKSGMFARARLAAGPAGEFVIVPRDAIIQRDDVYYVVTVNPAARQKPGPGQSELVMAMPVSVRLGADVGAWTAVSSPAIRAGVLVAVKGHDRIYGPMPVKSVPGEVSGPAVSGVPSTQPVDNGRREKSGVGSQ